MLDVHNLKIMPEYFNRVLDGSKKFEIRKNDRDFKKGDTVILNEFNDGKFTVRSILANIGYVCDYMQNDGHVVFSLIEPEIEQ
jgi:ASC-1-like (ASCH) protein